MTDFETQADDTLARLDQLASALIDQVITDSEVRELGVMLADEPEARTRYIENMQLHADLVEHYNEKSSKPSPVLSMLGADDATSVTPVVPPVKG